MNEYLDNARLPFFVYGTLRPNEANFHLVKNALVSSCSARLTGAQLWDIGPYPMALKSETGCIYGDLLEIEAKHFPRILKRLDLLEGVNSNAPTQPGGLYHRAYQSVETENGIVTAWIYWGKESVAQRGRVIAGGDWKARFSHGDTARLAEN